MATHLEFKPLQEARKDVVAILTLDRPASANAFNFEMIEGITTKLGEVTQRDEVRALLLRGRGKNFCAGADLNWMKSSVDLDHDANVAEAETMAEMFEALYHLPVPTIALPRGAVYGGAVGLVAACDFAIAEVGTKFCLSEVRVGLMPAVILPYVARKMSPITLRRNGLSGRVFGADEALAAGLLTSVCESDRVNETVQSELDDLLQGSPVAQAHLKKLHNSILDESLRQGRHTAEAIAQVRKSDAGQIGLKSFVNKHVPPWRMTSENWEIDG